MPEIDDVIKISVKNIYQSREVIEKEISPFDLQKADELFISNVIKGIQPITKYRKKEFGNTLSSKLVSLLNAQIRLT